MRIRTWALVILLGLGANWLSAQSAQSPAKPAMKGDMDGMDMSHGAMDKSDIASIPAGTLRVSNGDKSVDFTVAALAAMPHVSVSVVNDHTKANETYSGVLLSDLLAKVGVAAKPMGKALNAYIVAEGTDGYKTVYSIGEVAPYVNSSTVIVADSLDGKPIEKNGPLSLAASNEKIGARMVHNLAAIFVRTAQ